MSADCTHSTAGCWRSARACLIVWQPADTAVCCRAVSARSLPGDTCALQGGDPFLWRRVLDSAGGKMSATVRPGRLQGDTGGYLCQGAPPTHTLKNGCLGIGTKLKLFLILPQISDRQLCENLIEACISQSFCFHLKRFRCVK